MTFPDGAVRTGAMNETPTNPTPSPERRVRRGTALALALTAGLLSGSLAGGAAGGAIGLAMRTAEPSPATSSTTSAVLSASSSSGVDISDVVASVQDAVVTVEVASNARGGLAATGSGSGFIVTGDGLILTSYHVINGAAQITVVMTDGTTADATVVASNASRDVALLDISGSGLPTIDLASATAEVGQTVISMGTALGEYPNTVTLGVVSGLNREMTASTGVRSSETLTDVIQTDAALSSGMSGGPLLDAAGRAVGINTAVYGDANGIGFAVPISDGLALLASVNRA